MTRALADMTASRIGVPQLVDMLRAALDGSGPALGFGLRAVSAPDDGAGHTAQNAPDRARSVPDRVPDQVAVVVGTSGSTGAPRLVELDAPALLASAHATHERLGGTGQWLLALPATHVAGLQVLVRSIDAGTNPVALAQGPFRPQAFADAVERLDHAPTSRRYVSLVPTQLHRLVYEDSPEGVRTLAALATFDAILIGGAALNPALARAARDAGLAIRTTYGMSETSGGCVYDGVPLEGVRVRTDEAGRIQIAGPMLARGYLGDPAATAAAFMTDDGVRWHTTSDLGSITPDPVTVTIHGRADDVIITGGVNVAAGAVEALLAGWGGIGEACVVGVPDPEWGQAIVAVLTRAPAAASSTTTSSSARSETITLAAVRAHVAQALGMPAAPRAIRIVEALPMRGPGKVDRAAVRESSVPYTREDLN